jgi:high-affinity iron transporter
MKSIFNTLKTPPSFRVAMGVGATSVALLLSSSGWAAGASDRPGAFSAEVAAAPTTIGAATPQELQRSLHRLVGLLDYVASDYAGAVHDGMVVAPSEYAEQRSFIGEMKTLAQEVAQATPQQAAQAQLAARLGAIEGLVADRAAPNQVASVCRELRSEVIARWRVQVAPTRPANLARAAQLYGASCARCHGATGRADTPVAKRLTPAPANFQTLATAGVLTPYRVFNTLSFGIAGTAMAPFAHLSEEDRWSVAAHVVSLGTPPSGASASIGTFAIAKRSIAEAERAAQRGDGRGAAQSLVDGYLEGIEPSEAALRARDPEGVAALERAFVEARAALETPEGMAQFPRHAAQLRALVARAEQQRTSRSAGAAFAFGGGFLILLREGLEAALVVVMLLGMIRRTGRKDALRAVHLGWISALALGAVVFALSSVLLRVNSSREIMEGVVGMAAATVLFFVSWSLVAQAQAQRWMSFLKRNIEGSAAQRQLVAVFGMAFLAVFREAVETALFYQALALESGGHQVALAAGAAVGLLGMLGLLALLVRAGRKLDTRRFFLVTGALLYATCVVVAGKSMYALIEAGVLTPHPVRYAPTIPWLGVHPDLATLGLQLALVAAFAVAWRAAHRPWVAPASKSTTSSPPSTSATTTSPATSVPAGSPATATSGQALSSSWP